MSSKLRQYLYNTYISEGIRCFTKVKKDFSIQIDDQDDYDILTQFCNIFVTVGDKEKMAVELSGRFPITRQMTDLVEIYDGRVDIYCSSLKMIITPVQIEALRDLADFIRGTASIGHTVNNPIWFEISSRTISSLYRFIRVIKEYQRVKHSSSILS
ncbi:MAG: hypothetical protein ACLFSB_01420 [Chitinispirillaceae bacterium]